MTSPAPIRRLSEVWGITGYADDTDYADDPDYVENTDSADGTDFAENTEFEERTEGFGGEIEYTTPSALRSRIQTQCPKPMSTPAVNVIWRTDGEGAITGRVTVTQVGDRSASPAYRGCVSARPGPARR